MATTQPLHPTARAVDGRRLAARGLPPQRIPHRRPLGGGGFGITYLARDTPAAAVAIKEYLPSDLVSRGADQRSRCAAARRAPGAVRLGPRPLPRRSAHAGHLPPPEHRARGALLRRQRHRLHGAGVRGGPVAQGWLPQNAPPSSAQLLSIVLPLLDGLEGARDRLPAPRHQARQHLRARRRQPVLLDFGAARRARPTGT